jgi:hypothetical protein
MLIIKKLKIMRNLKRALFLFMALIITSCVNAQFRKTIYGNGRILTEERTPADATGIRVSSGIDVCLRQGDKPELMVEADENLHRHIITRIRNGILEISADAVIRRAKTKTVYVTLKDIKTVGSSSAGNITGISAIESDNIHIIASSAGDILLEVYARKINVTVSSSADVTLSGEADILSAVLSSAGSLNAYNLRTREAGVTVSSAGDANICVTEKLKAQASSAGDINYKGDPRYIDARASSAGSIRKK